MGEAMAVKRRARETRLNVRVSPEVRRQLDDMARRQGVTVSELLRAMVQAMATLWKRDGVRIASVAEQLGETIVRAMKGTDRL